MIHSLSLHDFRNYMKQSFVFEKKNVVFFGKNGRGKTNILEAISILSCGKSWRETKLFDVIRDGAESAMIEAIDDRKNYYRAMLRNRSRRFEKNEKKIPQHLFVGEIPSLLFVPEHLVLFSDVKKNRQRFFDRVIEQIMPSFAELLAKANKAVLQKNALLKSFDSDAFPVSFLYDQLQPWNQILADTIPFLFQERKKFLQQLQPILQKELSTISGTPDEIRISLHQEEDYEVSSMGVLRFFEREMNREIAARKTMIGSHRDDFVFEFRGKPLLASASRGEERSVLIALLMAEKQLLQSFFSVAPILLLDDVFSELDQSRQDYLEHLCDESQIFFTTTHQEHFENFGNDVQKIEIL